jgi:hypothetical protein
MVWCPLPVPQSGRVYLPKLAAWSDHQVAHFFARGPDVVMARWLAALLLAAIPVTASAQQLPNWPIERLCGGDRQCDSREVASRHDLNDQMWQKATPQRRADCLEWEAEFFRRYWPEDVASKRYSNLEMCILDPTLTIKTFPWH